MTPWDPFADPMFAARYKILQHVAQQRAERVDQFRLAVHEAGHAVAAAALGADLLIVNISKAACAALDPDGDLAGFSFSLPAKPRRQMAIVRAGALAEESYGYRSRWHDHECSVDVAQLLQLASQKGLTEEQALAEAEARARPLVEQFRPAIGAVARALIAKGALTGPQVRELMGGAVQ